MAPDLLFYDGHCGLCHRAVRFTLKRDDGSRFQFAPLQGSTLRERLSHAQVAALPDSLVLLAGDELLVKSCAIVYLLTRLGGVWGWVGRAVSLVPTAWADALYDCIACIRHRLFAPPSEACPLVPPDLRGRFLP